MKHQSTLPMLHSSRKQSEPKKNIKVIETKLSQHESQISKNQKFIITIANDFRLIKEELKVKEKQNQQLAEMHRMAIEDNQKLSKNIKELKQQIIKLQKTVQQKNRSSQGQKNLVSPALLNKQQQINSLKEQLIKQKKSFTALEHNIHSLTEQCSKLKLEVADNQKNKEIASQLKKCIQIQVQKSQKLAQQIKRLQSQKVQLEKQCQQKDGYGSTLRQHERSIQNLKKQNKKLSEQLQQSKVNYEKIFSQNKKKKQLIIELEEFNKKQERKHLQEVNIYNKIHELQLKQIGLKQIVNSKDKQIMRLSEEIRQLFPLKETNKKIQSHIRKLAKQKTQIQKLVQAIGKSIKCEFCAKIASKPVTCIPCGHSFCLDCKKGYQKQCKKCDGVKRQAVYRNELLDEVVLSYSNIKTVLQILKQIN